MVLTALLVMIVATLAQHLGLPEAIAEVITEISGCPKCCTFWASAIVLYFCGCDIFTAAGLSIIMAYMSHWFGLILFILSKKYNKLWQKINRR